MRNALAFVALLGLSACLEPSQPPTAQECVLMCESTQGLCGAQCNQDPGCVAECARTARRCVEACNPR